MIKDILKQIEAFEQASLLTEDVNLDTVFRAYDNFLKNIMKLDSEDEFLKAISDFFLYASDRAVAVIKKKKITEKKDDARAIINSLTKLHLALSNTGEKE